MEFSHIPVLLEQTIEALEIKKTEFMLTELPAAEVTANR